MQVGHGGTYKYWVEAVPHEFWGSARWPKGKMMDWLRRLPNCKIIEDDGHQTIHIRPPEAKPNLGPKPKKE